MTNSHDSVRRRSEQSYAAAETAQKRPGATHEEQLAGKLPPLETQQPDPILQLSVGRLGAGTVTLVAAIAALILGVVLYGLNSSAPPPHRVATQNSLASPAAAGAKAAPAAPSKQSAGTAGRG